MKDHNKQKVWSSLICKVKILLTIKVYYGKL